MLVGAWIDDTGAFNAGRLEKYREIAEKRGTSVEAVAALAGRKLIERARPGTYVQAADGGWVLR